mmetsp:Transcript_7759/g.16843  ORF Transcript_7759/g.16843 Transcript_7759/m.16843 type:complete len:146 (-) Transcript_7759:475-912(-)
MDIVIVNKQAVRENDTRLFDYGGTSNNIRKAPKMFNPAGTFRQAYVGRRRTGHSSTPHSLLPRQWHPRLRDPCTGHFSLRGWLSMRNISPRRNISTAYGPPQTTHVCCVSRRTAWKTCTAARGRRRRRRATSSAERRRFGEAGQR